jgi:hypothetical protein
LIETEEIGNNNKVIVEEGVVAYGRESGAQALKRRARNFSYFINKFMWMI